MRCQPFVPSAAACLLAVSARAADEPSPQALLVQSAYVVSYFQAGEAARLAVAPDAPGPVSMPLELGVSVPRALLDGLERAGPWLQLLGAGGAMDPWEATTCEAADVLTPPARLCGVRWRRGGFYSDVSQRLDRLSSGLKRRIVGEGLADRLEFDVDRSPELRFRWDFD